MNIKSYTNESSQQQSKVSKPDSDKKEEINATKLENKEVKANSVAADVAVASTAAVAVADVVDVADVAAKGKRHSGRGVNQVDVATAKATITTTNNNNLNVETIENASTTLATAAKPASLMVAINNNNDDCINNSNSSNINRHRVSNESDCNKVKQQQQQQHRRSQHRTLNENHNNSNFYVQTFTNTKELNQVNLNSSTTKTTTQAKTKTTKTPTTSQLPSTTTATATTTSALALASAIEIAQQQQLKLQQRREHQQQQQQLQQQAQQLIMSPTTTMYANLRKSHSTPTLQFDGSNIVVDERRPSDNANHEYGNINNTNNGFAYAVDTALEAGNNTVAVNDVAITGHCKRQQQLPQHQQHEQFTRISATTDCSNHNGNVAAAVATMPDTPEALRFGCAHYKRRAMFVTPCCNKFYKCRFCHDENESHHFDRKTLTELICSECNTRQKVQEQCENCSVRFGKYTCLICNLFDDADKQQYHCHGCGICRIGGADNFFHCEVCNMCLPIQLKIDGHRCVENISRSHCPVCLGDIHTSRIPCHIPDCGHLLHKMCFDQLLASGHYTCPTCQTSLIDMTALWEYLDAQALRMPVTLKYENQRVHIFCNDCHKTSKTKFHFIGLKCAHCGAYNTTQDVKRRLSLVADEPSSA